MERVEEYLEAIYELQSGKSKAVKTGDLARRLNVKPSSVTEMLLKLRDKGYVDYQPYRGAVLTKKGEKVAKRIKKYHEISYNFFRILGLEESVAERLACELEHHLNDEVAEKFCIFISGFCEVCEDCDFALVTLENAPDGKYEVVASPRFIVKPGDIVEVREGKLVIGGEEIEVHESLRKLIVLARV
ncbi:MAG: metal-dependent transcriptional regulator [Archaeoglobaceae archaeon]